MTKYFFIFILLFSKAVFSQTILGKITEAGTTKEVSASVIFKSSDDKNMEYLISKNGSYTIKLKNNYDKIIIEVTAPNYRIQQYTIENPEKNKSYTVDFKLSRELFRDIEEVEIRSPKKSFEVKKDTVNYNVSSYSDGTEKKIEQLLKKLPGIELNDNTGEIKYKGKAIETVKIDGDDLFGSNYAIATKNINSDIVDQIQAIENYSENTLLKGIEVGDKVALNIKLKKGKMNFSGDINYESGFSSYKIQRYNFGLNIIQISNKYKAFGTFGYNNIGVNNTSFDYFSFNPNADQAKENNFMAKKIIPETIFTNYFNDGRANVNNTLFNSYSNIFKLSKKIQLKLNLYQISDKLRLVQDQLTENFINGEYFTTTDFYDIEKRPELYRLDSELKINTSKSSLMQYNVRYYRENIFTDSHVVLNDTQKYLTALSSKSSFFKQNINFTYKLSDNKAVQGELYHSDNKLPQIFRSESASDPIQVLNSGSQFSEFTKTVVGAKITLLGSKEKSNTKYYFAIGEDFTQTPLSTHFSDSEGNIFVNNVKYNKNNLYTLGSYHWDFKGLKISPSYIISLVKQNLQSNGSMFSKNNIFAEPELRISYKLSDISNLALTTNYKQDTFSEEYFFSNPVLISNRSTMKNIPSLETQKRFSTNLFYSILNLYKQYQFTIGGIYSLHRGNYFSNIMVNEFSTRYNYFYLSENNENLSFSMMIDKYIPIVKSKIKVKSYYSVFKFKNIVNSSGLTDNTSINSNVELSFKTAFSSKISFENIFSYNYISTKKENRTDNTNVNFRNNFKIILRPVSDLVILSSLDYINPNVKTEGNKNFFIDLMVSKTFKNSFTLELNGKNLLNNKKITRVLTSDYNIEYLSTNLLPIYVSMGINYRF